MDGMVSVIIPVYDRQHVLEECVRSVFAQTYTNYEIILIDDGSHDGTPALCAALAEEDDRVVFLQGTHGGVSAARNIGLDAARGEYLFFLDSDDVIHPRLLETFVDGLRRENASVAATQVVGVAQRNWHKVAARLRSDDGLGELIYYDHPEAMGAMLCENCALSCIGGVMLRRDAVGDTRFRTDLFIGEDFYFLYENMCKGLHCLFLKERWYYVRNHEGNSSWDYSYDGFWTRFLRRRLVWRNEEACGRKKFADHQKRNGLSVFLNCQNRFGWKTEDCRRMRAVMREHGRELFPALTLKERVHYLLAVYCPPVHKLLVQLVHRLK